VQAAYTPTHPTQYHTHSVSPAPHAAPVPVQQPAGYQAITPHPFSTPQPAAPIPQYTNPRPSSTYQQTPYVQPAPVGYKAPQPVEVYILNDHANNSIPPEIREQFQRDEQGRVLFFTAPPLNTSTVVNKEGRALGHSARYLAGKAEWEAERAAKRKARDEERAAREQAAKKPRLEADEKLSKDIANLKVRALEALEDQLAVATRKEFEALFPGGETGEGLTTWLSNLTEAQKEVARKNMEREERKLREREAEKIPITGMTVRLEDNF
jgi:chromatin structure-remodeling complex subunit RSC1/2